MQRPEENNMFVSYMLVICILTAAIVLFVTKVPECRLMWLIILAGIKIPFCVLLLQFHSVGRLLFLIQYMLHFLVTNQAQTLNMQPLMKAIEITAVPAWLVGTILSTISFSLWCLSAIMNHVDTEEKIIKKFSEQDIAETAQSWNIPPNIFELPAKDMVEEFAKLRKAQNIPPNIFARKIKDENKRLALLYFQRFLKNKKIMKICYPDL